MWWVTQETHVPQPNLQVIKLSYITYRLEEELLNLEKTEGEFTRWNDQLVTIQGEVSKVESICEQEIAPDLETLEQQRNEAKVGSFIECLIFFTPFP